MQKEKMFYSGAILKTFFLFSFFKKQLLEEELFFWRFTLPKKRRIKIIDPIKTKNPRKT